MPQKSLFIQIPGFCDIPNLQHNFLKTGLTPRLVYKLYKKNRRFGPGERPLSQTTENMELRIIQDPK